MLLEAVTRDAISTTLLDPGVDPRQRQAEGRAVAQLGVVALN